MKVTGFSFIKNAIKYDYPIVEAIKSILPLCDDFVVAVGKSDDDTLDLIKQIAPDKIKIIETIWDENLREGGRVLADETNKAFASISSDTDWAFYVQGDEVLHERHLNSIYENMQKYKDESRIDGFLLKYQHFFGSYDYVGSALNWYKNEIRIVRNDQSIYSYRDAQGFRKKENEKLRVIPLDACMYHYGWVKDPRTMQVKKENFYKLWHDDNWMDQHFAKADLFDYASNIKELKPFLDVHPEIMKERISLKNWKFDYDISLNRRTLKDKVKEFAAENLGIHFEYRNYKSVKPFK